LTSRELYALLDLLAKLEAEVATDTPAHLSVLVLRIVAERKLTERKEFG